MKKLLAWATGLVLAASIPVVNNAAFAKEKWGGFRERSDQTVIDSSLKQHSQQTEFPSLATEHSDNEESDHENNDHKDFSDEDQGQQQSDQTVAQSVYRKHAKSNHGIEHAIESLLKARQDGKGAASDDALDAVIEKLKARLVEDGEANTKEEAQQQVEATLGQQVDNGTADEQTVEVLVTAKMQDNKLSEARHDLEKALRHNAQSDKLYKLLSKVLKQQGDTQNAKVYVQGQPLQTDVKPIIKEGRTLVPVAVIVKSLGANVNWDPDSRTVTINKGNVKIELPIGEPTVTVNGQKQTIDTAAEITEGRTVVPLRFLSEILKQKVVYDPETKLITVTDPNTTTDNTTQTSAGSSSTASQVQ
ncbi:copper amine oxidase N-terminal domain-containing protein [Effusibacillus dendaii]|uniref:Copper amine oxidase-like N-terminal domain-containing protein n=1 Tax=Effusibacillus dendaii TaxID=2743772 RepID=A0A7I8DEW5_9BACL|nr:copper amine oxidase N-terminal domain-containing protein [Effusibacillus dendaii]BCJ87832.1 hypothetical protein skT53_28170 [Effusibacillus dendaii]